MAEKGPGIWREHCGYIQKYVCLALFAIYNNIFLFLENDVDGEAFLMFKDSDIISMIPSIGARRKLITYKQRMCSLIGNVSVEQMKLGGHALT